MAEWWNVELHVLRENIDVAKSRIRDMNEIAKCIFYFMKHIDVLIKHFIIYTVQYDDKRFSSYIFYNALISFRK